MRKALAIYSFPQKKEAERFAPYNCFKVLLFEKNSVIIFILYHFIIWEHKKLGGKT